MAVKHCIIVGRDNNAIIVKSEGLKDNKYATIKDENSTTMACLNAVIEVLENIPEDSKDLHVLLIPKCLGLMLKQDNPQHIKDNGYRTDKGSELSEGLIDLMIYANELRAWLTTSTVRFKIQGSQLLYKNEQTMINQCWDLLDKIMKPKSNNKPQRAAGTKPQRPDGVRKPQRPDGVRKPTKPGSKPQVTREESYEEQYEEVNVDVSNIELTTISDDDIMFD
jgi:predicted ribonuclease YlaK